MCSSEDGQQNPSIHKGVKGVILILNLTPPPKLVIKGQPPNIDMFGIKSKVLMRTLKSPKSRENDMV